MKAEPTHKVRVRPIALPTEHGGWVLLFAPIILGLVRSWSVAGVCLAIAALFAFLTRQPLRLAWLDIKRHKRYPRTSIALGFAGIYGLVALVALTAAILLAKGPFWPPLIASCVLGILQSTFDFQGQGRKALPEVAGALALSLLTPAIILIGGGSVEVAAILAMLISMQLIGAVLYAGARLHKGRGQAVTVAPTLAFHVLGLLGALAFARSPWVITTFAIVLVRALWGLSPRAKALPTPLVGLQELGYSVLTVAALCF